MAGTVNQLCDGRLQLTVGLGYREEEFDGLGISRTQRVPRLEESIGLIRELWAADKPFTHTGRTFTYHDVESRPRPGRHRPSISAVSSPRRPNGRPGSVAGSSSGP